MNAQDLKNSILQLAIQGKLVEQRKEEGTAKDLIKQIEAEKKHLIKEGKIKKQKELPEIKVDEIPFDIPESWEWVKLGTICNIINGFTPSKSNPKFWINGTIPWFTIADVRNQGRFINYTEQSITDQAISKNSERIIPKDSILLCCTASVGEYAYTNIDLTTNQQFNGLVVKNEYEKIVYPLFLYQFAITLKRTLLLQAGKTTINFVSVKKVSEIVIPIPPLEEQKRIVAKIEDLMPYVDKYDIAYSELEELNKKFPEDMQRSILQYAIQGKLVEQREEYGTAEELYMHIQEEKKRLTKEGKIKKSNPLPEITADEIPFEIPENWKWVRLGEVATKITDGSHNPPPKRSNGYYVISAKNVKSGKIIFDNVDRYTDEEGFQKENSRTNIKRGDIIMGIIGGSIGNIATYNHDEKVIAQRSISIIDTLASNEYIKTVLQSPFIQYQLKNTSSTAQGGVYLGTINELLIPLPPLAEQKRIVEKIEELLPYTKQLAKKPD